MEPLKLLIYVDDSLASRRAVQLVAPLVAAGAAAPILLTSESDVEQASTILDEAAKLLDGGNAVQRHARPGPLESVLINEVRENGIDLVVIAPPKRAPWQRWLRGPQAVSLARHVPTSLLLVRGRPVQTTLQRALIAGGGGRAVLDDAAMAARLLVPIGGEAVVCHVLSQVPMIYGSPLTHDQLLSYFLESGSPEIENLQEAVQVLRKAGVSAQLKLRVGPVVDEVLEELREGCYNFLVVGSHHAASMLERLLFEDLSADLLIKSPVPVLLVRASED